MAIRSTYLFTRYRCSTALSTNRLVESHKEAVLVHMQNNDLGPFKPFRSHDANDRASKLYNHQRDCTYFISVNFPTPIWGFSLLYTPIYADSFGVPTKYFQQVTR